MDGRGHALRLILRIALAVVLGATTGASFQCSKPKTGVSVVFPATGEARQVIELDTTTIGHIAAGAGAVWVATSEGVSAFDPEEDRVAAVQGLSWKPDEIAAAGRYAWAIDPVENEIVRMEAGPARVTGRTPLRTPVDCRPGETCPRLAATPTAAWVADPTRARLVEVGARTQRVERSLPLARSGPLPIGGFALDGDRAWVAADGALIEVDLQRGRVARRLRLRGRVFDLAANAGAVWVARQEPAEIVRVVPPPPELALRAEADLSGAHLAATPGATWATVFSASAGEDRPGGEGLAWFDNRTGTLAGRTRIRYPVDVATGFGVLWVTHEAD